MSAFDRVAAEVTVEVGREEAFRIFTADTGLWWRRGPRFRASGRTPGLLEFEPRVGGRLLETFETESGRRVVVSGRIAAWEPPAFFAFEWRGVNFAPDDPSTTVEVRFDELGPCRTRVALVHRGWPALRADHPVRHGQGGQEFIHMPGMWWGSLLTSFRERSSRE